jgi:hypothetical protein
MDVPVEFSRKPEDYCPEPGGHFLRRKKRRDFPGTAIRMCIESGDVTDVRKENGEWRVKLTTMYLNWEFNIVIAPEKGYVITCFPTDEAWYK